MAAIAVHTMLRDAIIAALITRHAMRRAAPIAAHTMRHADITLPVPITTHSHGAIIAVVPADILTGIVIVEVEVTATGIGVATTTRRRTQLKQ